MLNDKYEYKVLYAQTPESLSTQVTEYLNAGWHISGPLSTLYKSNSYNTWLYQPVIKYPANTIYRDKID
jgi:hypothetical protein